MASAAEIAASHLYASLQATVWTCATTIFLCTWVAYHPNVPDPKESCLRRKAKRVTQAIAGLLSPELILIFAFKERVFSRRALENLKRNTSYREWTQTHASFAYMGGFKDGEKMLYKYDFFRCAINGEIETPTITEEEIQDRSKTSSLGKLITVVQIALFIARFLFGAIPKDNTIPLGFVTLSLVLINVFCYGCWWSKPVSVGVPVAVFKREPTGAQTHVQIPSADLTTTFWKAAEVLILTASGVIISGFNLLAIPFHHFHEHIENILWVLSAGVLCLSSLILYLIVFSIVIFSKYPEYSRGGSQEEPFNRYPFWKAMVVVISIIVISARVCLVVLAIIGLRL